MFSDQKQVLFISYFFPPMGGPGVQRSQKFVKYLPDYNWYPLVLSVKDIEYIAYDLSLLAEIPYIEIYRSGSIDPMRLLNIIKKLIPPKNDFKIYTQVTNQTRNFFRGIFPIDSKIGWIPFALRKGTKIIKLKRIKAIYATISPYSAAIIGFKLAKKFQLPLLLDYRDLWKGKPDITFFSRWHKHFAERWEKRILTLTKRVVVNTKLSQKRIQNIYPEINKEKFSVIYNGWDSNDYKDYLGSKKYCESKKKDNIIFTYTGGFYGNRTPEFFIDTIQELYNQKIIADNIRFRFIGNYFDHTKQLLSHKDLGDLIEIIPQVSHKKCIEYLFKSDFLMLFIAKKASEIILPAKIFEYLATKKPILAMIPQEGEAAMIIRKNNAGLISEIDDKKRIKKNVLELIKLKFHNKIEERFDLKRRDYAKYERKYLTKKLALLLDSMLNEKA